MMLSRNNTLKCISSEIHYISSKKLDTVYPFKKNLTYFEHFPY